MNCILEGYGEIGRAVKKVFGDYHDIDVHDIKDANGKAGTYDLLLVCFPYSKDFVDQVNKYREAYNAKATIIFSTVAVGTTRQIPDAVHSPVEGKHPELAESIRFMPRWVGGYNKTVDKFFTEAGFNPKYTKLEATEFIKLRSTSLYGLNIEFARYTKKVCDELGIPYHLVNDYDLDYNMLYKFLGMPQYQRYILYPPEGNIGGKCVVPNARILDSQYPSVFLKEIYRDKEGDGGD